MTRFDTHLHYNCFRYEPVKKFISYEVNLFPDPAIAYCWFRQHFNRIVND